MALVLDGTTGITSANIADGTIVNADIADGTIADAKIASGGGKVVQLLSVTKTDTAAFSGTNTWHDSGLSLAITPSSASNKVLLSGFVSIGNSTATANVSVQLRRDSTVIGEGDAVGSRVRAHSETDVRAWAARSIPFNVLDAPSSTSATTYKVYLSSGSNTIYLNQDGENLTANNHRTLVSTLTLTEITG